MRMKSVRSKVHLPTPHLLVLLLVLAATVTGCTSKPPLYRTRLPEFQDGETTLDDVVKKLGKPALLSRGADHRTLIRYVEGESEVSLETRLLGVRAENAGVLRMVSLSFIFDGKDRLQQQLVSTAVLPVTGGNHDVHVGPKLNAGVMGGWQRGRTTLNDVFAQLGEPVAQLLSLEGDLVQVWLRAELVPFDNSRIREECLAVRFSGDGRVEEFGLMSRNQAMRAFP